MRINIKRSVFFKSFIIIYTSLRIVLYGCHPEHGVGIEELAFFEPPGVYRCGKVYPDSTGAEYVIPDVESYAGFDV